MVSRTADPLQIVLRDDLCSGCGACQGLLGDSKVAVGLNADGYLRPTRRAELTPQESELISNVCPGLNIRHAPGGIQPHPIWGPMLDAYIAAATDEEIRHRGSSGGVLTALQAYLLEQGLVDYVVNIGVARDDPFRNEIKICRGRADVLASAGSRYAPSAPLAEIGSMLAAPGRFAFVGKPCDVAALRRLALHDPRVDEKVPYMFSFMCAGMPSMKGTHQVVERLGGKPEQVVEFQYRGNGWPGLATAEFRDGSQQSMTYEQSWGGVLNKFVQWRCRLCADGTGEHADLVGADAWHKNPDGSPDLSEHQGRSFLLTRTERGRELLQAAVRAGAIELLGQAAPADIEAVQFHQAYRKKTMLMRYAALLILRRRFPRYDLGSLIRAAMRVSPLANLRAFAGTFRRARNRTRPQV